MQGEATEESFFVECGAGTAPGFVCGVGMGGGGDSLTGGQRGRFTDTESFLNPFENTK